MEPERFWYNSHCEFEVLEAEDLESLEEEVDNFLEGKFGVVQGSIDIKYNEDEETYFTKLVYLPERP